MPFTIRTRAYAQAIYPGRVIDEETHHDWGDLWQSALLDEDISTFGRSLIDDAAASNARTTLGLGTMAVEAAASYETGAHAAATYFPIAGGAITGITKIGATYKWSLYPDYAGLGDIAGNSTLMGSEGGDFAFFPRTDSGTAGSKIQFCYYSGDQGVRAAVEVANVASGFGSLLLMKGGGKIGMFGATPVVQAGAITAYTDTGAYATDHAALAANVAALITAIKNIGITA